VVVKAGSPQPPDLSARSVFQMWRAPNDGVGTSAGEELSSFSEHAAEVTDISVHPTGECVRGRCR
jgi:hypothetical protein